MNAQTICFREEDLTLFCQASGDRNPLHLDKGYASRTAYGQRVVYGALGAVACLGNLKLSPQQRITKITADFHRPMFLDVDYRTERVHSAVAQTVRLLDGTVPVLTLAVVCEQATQTQVHCGSQSGTFERSEARELSWTDVQPGLEFTGYYAADSGKLKELCQRWNVATDSFAMQVLLWSSYFIGMELPGRHALFFRLSLDLCQHPAVQHPFHYRGVVSSSNKAVEQIKIQISLSFDHLQLASGLLTAFIRPELEALDFRYALSQSSVAHVLEGKVALIIGASRGLGAALAASMALEGAHVVTLSRSPIEFQEALPSAIQQRITTETGDSADLESVSAIRDKIVQRFGKLDFLICNAFPPIPALRLEPNALSRIQAYIQHSTDLVLVPLCVFLPLLNEHRGCAVIISSSAVERPVREWPHYVAAKSATEALGAVASLQYPNVSTLLVRPERLLTDMTNTPMGRQSAMPPLQFARQITKKLQDLPRPGVTEVFRGTAEEPVNRL